MTPSVLYVVTEPWYFANHRLDHARALLADGFEVHVATRHGERLDELVAAGCTVHELDLDRGLGRPRALWREVRTLRKIVRRVRPRAVHAVALKPVAVSLALLVARRRPALVLSVNGLGLSAARGGGALRAIRTVIAAAGRMPNVELLFQTHADRRAVLGDRAGGVVIPGVGVDVDRFAPAPPPRRPPVVVVYLGRAVASKGLMDIVAALERSPIDDLEVRLYCTIDPSSPGSLTTEELRRIEACPGVELRPPTRDAAGVLRDAHAAILASRAGEGVSKFVLEALASARPVLLSAGSGSGEVVVAGETGLTFPAGDVDALHRAFASLASMPDDELAAMGRAGRRAAEQRYALQVILPQIVDLHRRACGVHR